MINKYSTDEHRYDDMLELPYPYKTPRKRMSMINRGAQFAPFAALVGHDKAIEETARLTDYKIPLSDEEMQTLNERLSIIQSLLPSCPIVTVTYFVKDLTKDGGAYISKDCSIRIIDEYERKLIMHDKSYIYIDDIYSIHSPLFDKFD